MHSQPSNSVLIEWADDVVMDQEIQKWLRFADSDMVPAEGLQRIGQELHALFFLQQAVEKTLKALLVKQTHAAPPRIHSLRTLAERCGLSLPMDEGLLLENLSEYYVESRYPGDWQETSPDVMAKEAERLIPAAKEFIRWLRSRI